MTADIFRILVFAVIPVLFVEVFLVLKCTGVNPKFDRILMIVAYATVGFMLFGSFVADCWVF